MGKVQEEDHVHKETNPPEEVTQNVLSPLANNDAVLKTSGSSIAIQETRVVPDEITGSALLVQEAVQLTQVTQNVLSPLANTDAVLETSGSSIAIQETRVVPDEITGSASLVQEAVQFTQAALEQNDGQDLRKHIAKLLSTNRAMLFIEGTPEEPKSNFSKVIVDIFRRDKIRFGHFNVLEDNAIRKELIRVSKIPTFPQLFISGNFFGGYHVIRNYHDRNELGKLLMDPRKATRRKCWRKGLP